MAEERMLLQSNEAVGWAALAADCMCYFGYPITPQNEIIEWFAKEFPKRGKIFIQSQCETGASNMLYGAAACGVRSINSTSGPGWGLMQEAISNAANAEIPFVIVLVQRGGPGAGTTNHAQMDYISTTKGGGQGGYKTPVLAPNSPQDTVRFGPNTVRKSVRTRLFAVAVVASTRRFGGSVRTMRSMNR